MKALTTLICMVALVAPSAALAQTSSDEGYAGPGGVSGQVQRESDGGGPSDDGGGSLPFSGRDLIVLGAGGAILLAVGFGLRRVTHRAEPSARPRGYRLRRGPDSSAG
jgi:hypothetical protein